MKITFNKKSGFLIIVLMFLYMAINYIDAFLEYYKNGSASTFFISLFSFVVFGFVLNIALWSNSLYNEFYKRS
jgi:uncharacterized integral membrane protein